jgi:hypothetical protein
VIDERVTSSAIFGPIETLKSGSEDTEEPMRKSSFTEAQMVKTHCCILGALSATGARRMCIAGLAHHLQ